MDKNLITVDGEATYCPEDNKIRLYVGRVSRPEFDALRAEGWAVCSKQREAGKGDFAAVWTPGREDTALAYSGGYIGDEDAGPQERAADRAERFGGYRENRREDARAEADRYASGPDVIGVQDKGRGVRIADRLDRTAGRACSQWEKAEYWQRRTAGVISHALYLASPGVRMGRIKKLEAELRRCGDHPGRWRDHYTLRLAYERQMLEAEGGRAGTVDIEPGGFWKGGLILKVNKSSVTGRVVSVGVKVPKITEWHYQIANVPGTDYALMTCEVERAAPGAYRPPTDEERQAFQAAQKAAKDARGVVPIINPTRADADRLQAQLNAQAADEDKGKNYPRKAGEVEEMTQARYSGWWTDGKSIRTLNGAKIRVVVRGWGSVVSVVVLTDKPQKPFPATVWPQEQAPAPVEAKTAPSGCVVAQMAGWTQPCPMLGTGCSSDACQPAEAPAAVLEVQTPADVEAERDRAERRAKLAELQARRLVGRSVDTTGDLFDRNLTEAPLFAAGKGW